MDRVGTKRGTLPQKKRRPKKDAGSDTSRLVIGCAKGCAVGALSGAAAVLALAGASSASPDPAKLTYIMGLCAFVLACLVAGASASRFTKEGIVAGAVAAAMLSVVIFAIALIPSGWERTVPTGMRVAFHSGAVGIGVIGAAVFKPRQKKRKRRK